eukprot:3329267-Pyramimonas_sp.AAC.1
MPVILPFLLSSASGLALESLGGHGMPSWTCPGAAWKIWSTLSQSSQPADQCAACSQVYHRPVHRLCIGLSRALGTGLCIGCTHACRRPTIGVLQACA